MRAWQAIVTMVGLGLLLGQGPVWAGDQVLQQAQQKLIELGYDVGEADGVSGPRTRQALEAFQRARDLPVTGTLDAATLQALHPPKSGPRANTLATSFTKSPLHVVVEYLRFQASQPARVLPYVTDNFLQGLSPQEWIEQFQQARERQGEVYNGWKVQSIHVADTQAIIYVQTRVRLYGQEHTRYEVFTLVRDPEAEWLIDGWRLETLAPRS